MRQLALKSLNNCGKTLLNRDFFGIRDITSKDIAAAFANTGKVHESDIKIKYDSLIVERNKLANEESRQDLTYGQIRRDDRNEPKYHGQFEEDREDRLYDSVSIKQKFVPEPSDGQGTKQTTPAPEATSVDTSDEKLGNPAYLISEVGPVEGLGTILDLFKSKQEAHDIVKNYANTPPLTFFHDQTTIKRGDSSAGLAKTVREQAEKEKTVRKLAEAARTITKSADLASTVSKPTKLKEPSRQDNLDPNQTEFIEPNNLVEKREPPTDVDDLPYEITRFDKTIEQKYDIDKKAKPVRKPALEHLASKRESLTNLNRPCPLDPQIKFDSKGLRNYANQVPDWYKARKVDILDYLKQSIIYHNYDILAINKPYGLASHSEPSDREIFNVNNLISELAKSALNIDQVYLAHRLDKTTTGVLLFATSQLRAKNLQKLFRSDGIKKTYLALTRGIPDPHEGVIDIPIGEMQVAGKTIMCPVPEKLAPERQLARHYAEARRAVTNYKSLTLGKGNISLIELQPKSGVKHQLRCHLGFGLKTPILGDHKYTDLGKLAPQRLPTKALQALQIRQTKVRTLPIHLHAKSIVIPNAKPNGEPLFINAPLPHHFKENMKSLGIKYEE